MPPKKCDIGPLTRRAKAGRRIRANQTEEERALFNERARQRIAQIRAEAAAERLGVTLQRSHSATSDLLRSPQTQRNRLRVAETRQRLAADQHQPQSCAQQSCNYYNLAGRVASYSMLPINNIKFQPDFEERTFNDIKLEPDSESFQTDGAHSSTKEIPTETDIFDEVDSKIPAGVKVEQPEVYIDYPGQEMHPSSESCLLASTLKNAQLETFGSTELVKQELSDMLYEDRRHRFSEMMDMSGNDLIRGKTMHTHTKSSWTENLYKESLNFKNYKVSENMLPVSEISDKSLLIKENFHLQNVDTILKHTQTSMNALDYDVGHNSSSSQKMHSGIASQVDDISDLASVNRQNRTHIGLVKCGMHNPSSTKVHYLKCHKRKHTGEKPYKCDDCEASFTGATGLKYHQRTHTGEKPYKCDVCGVSFTGSTGLKYHQRTHTGEKPYSCSVCGASFTTCDQMNKHTRTHVEEKPYKCDICGATFSTNLQLKPHRRKHTGEKPFKCDVCGTSFAARQYLKCHRLVHTEEKPYKCNVCDATFKRSTSLKNHKRTHTGEKPYKCEECGASYTSSQQLKYHKRTHTGEKPYKCEECGASYTSSQQLKEHKRTHTGEKPWKCDLCDASFTAPAGLRYHKRIHTGEKPHKCDLCGVSYITNQQLKYHMKTHTEERPYKCEQCGVSFNGAGGLQCHKRTHTGDTPYKCDKCSMSFTTVESLNYHKRTHIKPGVKPEIVVLSGTCSLSSMVEQAQQESSDCQKKFPLMKLVGPFTLLALPGSVPDGVTTPGLYSPVVLLNLASNKEHKDN